MARTSGTVQVEIDNLRAAIGTGALRVRFADRDVTYRSLADMRGSLAMLEDELAGLNGQTRVRQVQLHGSKGL